MEEGQQERRAKLLTRASPDKFALLDDLCRTSWQKKRDSRLLKEAVTDKQEAYVLALVEGFVRKRRRRKREGKRWGKRRTSSGPWVYHTLPSGSRISSELSFLKREGGCWMMKGGFLFLCLSS